MARQITAWILCLCCLASTARLSATEPWADPRLKIVDSLQLWIDATRQNAAHKALQIPELSSLQPIDLALDGSGQGRHLIQKEAMARPQFVSSEGHTALRFSGQNQHLGLTDLKQSLKQTTIFLVVVPFSNRGDFRAFLALNKTGVNDYVSGLTLDLGPGGTQRWQTFNPEGAGFGGAVNLMRDGFDFGTLQRVCVTSTPGPGGTRLYINGNLNGQRDRDDTTLVMDQITLGARFYTNGGAPVVRGFLDGDICEVLLYNRVLTDAERVEVEKYLSGKYGQGKTVALPPRPGVGKPLVAVRNPPPVQMLVPGFTVKQLPVDLPNINNVLYRPDGKLVALGYNGNIYLISDSDSNGLEDRAELFWENKGRMQAPIGMALTPPGYRRGDGVFVASKGKVSLIVDTDGDGKADKEIIVAQGWQPLSHGVDALGVAVDPRDHSVFFGLGTSDYTNPYQIDKEGKAHYRLDSERGTILRVSPDFKSREIVATGIRFPVAIRFNSNNDLFCTDQEGATWLANGNPLDELLHIEKGRHYGFPPHHPRHLPKVIDEPSVFDYGPQHQSTCGLNFNEPVHKGPVFGPTHWTGDALVSGYTRGKLYRTRLVKTAGGHVAYNQILAALNMLTVDACVSPKGDLVVAVHSGGPDWGSGPDGKGKLYKISYTGKDLPQPVLAWAQGPREVRVAFDRPIELENLRGLVGKVGIEDGAYVSPGDRFEVLRPGYQVVQDQLNAPRFDLGVLSVQAASDRRTLILATPAHPEAVSYALTLPGLGRSAARPGELPQAPETDLHYDLCGVEAVWKSIDGRQQWSGWLPHVNLAVARKLTASSAQHDELWALLKQPGQLTLRTKLNLWHMLRPAVQPGAKIDHAWPAEHVTLTFRARTELQVKVLDQAAVVRKDDEDFRAATTLTPKEDASTSVEVTLPTGNGEAELTLVWHTQEDSRPRALPLARMLMPWAALHRQETSLANRDIPELKGGSWARGRKVFFSEEALCSRCHRVQGEGASIGPDLSNLTQRDYASVLRDVANPSFAINPDYLTQVVELKTGRVLVGVVRTMGARLILGDANGKEYVIERDEVESITTSAKSLMPEGIDKKLGPEKMKDLLVFLLAEPPRMPDYGKDAPPPRTRKEVDAVLAGAEKRPEKLRPLHLVLVAGRKDHGPGEHDYPAWQKVWQELLGQGEGVKVTTAMDWPDKDDLKTADVLVFYQQGKWTPERARDIDAYLERGGGLVYIHYAVDGGADAPGFAQRIGLAWQGGKSKFRHGPLELGFETGTRHPIGRNIDKIRFVDESYWQLVGDPKGIKLLASGPEDGKQQPLFWTLEPAKGRVFVSIPGHFAWTFDDPLFRILLLRGIAWTCRESVDRFNPLVLPGARVKDE
jgi:putative heme-binding domain-containing protein